MSLATAMPEKPKPAPKPKGGGKRGPVPDPTRARSVLTNIRSTEAWKLWLQRFAGHQRKDVSDLIDEALLRYAREAGFEMPPKR